MITALRLSSNYTVPPLPVYGSKTSYCYSGTGKGTESLTGPWIDSSNVFNFLLQPLSGHAWIFKLSHGIL